MIFLKSLTSSINYFNIQTEGLATQKLNKEGSMLRDFWNKLFKRQSKPKEKYYNVPDAMVGLNMPKVGEFLTDRFYELKKVSVPLVEILRKEEAPRAKWLKEGIIEDIQEHTPDTLGNLEAALNRGLEAIETERKKLGIFATPLP